MLFNIRTKNYSFIQKNILIHSRERCETGDGMKSFPLDHVLQTAFLRIIPPYHSQVLANTIVNSGAREFGISHKPAVSDVAILSAVVENIFFQVIKTCFDVERHLQVRLSAQFVMKLGFNHYQLLLVVSYDIHFVWYASTEQGLASRTLEPFSFENFGHEIFEQKSRWTKLHDRTTERITSGNRPTDILKYGESMFIDIVGSHAFTQFRQDMGNNFLRRLFLSPRVK